MRKASYTFGPFLMDPESRLLFRNGERVPLPPKAIEILLALVGREGQLVTKDELLKEVWPDTFVEEGNLARHVFLLRKILGEASGGASYVETVPKRGYRFIGPVRREHARMTLTAEERTSEHITIEETDTPDPPRRQNGKRRLAIGVGIAILAGVVASLVWTRGRMAMPVRSLLVLPFANLSMAGDSEYYSDGLTEELINAFSSVQGLRVVPRTTAFQFKGKSGDVRAIGRQLEADAVLDGRVQRDGNRLRIYLSLTRTSDGQTLWSQTYDRRTEDVFATQEEIARSVLRAVFPHERQRIDVPPPSGTTNLEAQNLYLRANYLRNKHELKSALVLFQRATQLDPSYAQAWGGVAYCYGRFGSMYVSQPKDAFPLAIQALHRALALNARLAHLHAVSAQINFVYLRDWDATRRELETAIALDPNDGESHHLFSHYWVSRGRFAEAEAEGKRALDSDPLNFDIGAHQVWLRLQKGEYEKCESVAHPTLELDPSHRPTLSFLLKAYEESGNLEQAIAVRRRLAWERPSAEELATAKSHFGVAGYWRAQVDQLEARHREGPTRPTDIAVAYVHLGDRQHALDWLERAVEERDAGVIYLKVNPAFASLRTDPRFKEIVRAAGIPESSP